MCAILPFSQRDDESRVDDEVTADRVTLRIEIYSTLFDSLGMEDDEFYNYNYLYDGNYEETPVVDVIELPTYEKIIIPKKFSDYFPVRRNHQYIWNHSIEMRLLSGISSCDSRIPFEKRSCIIWTKRTRYIAVAGKQIDCRRLIYDYCVGDIEDEVTTKIGQTCPKQFICLEHTHLVKRSVKRSQLPLRSQQYPTEIKWNKLIELHRPILEQSVELPRDENKTPSLEFAFREEIVSTTTTPCNTPDYASHDESCDRSPTSDRNYASDSDLSYIQGSPDRSDIEITIQEEGDSDSISIPEIIYDKSKTKRKRDEEYQTDTKDNTSISPEPPDTRMYIF
jgi:hypothetical protein